ncbi:MULTISPECIES: hypothetical protein [Actinosynnema]|uniref:hypothetical protein n=1 Tax=Actinosynnema TaxID=40566 RepID=UPI0020A50882|nr:hypothetical protein [Actinosynnema pretiosum]MCP2098967.1 hypothetical protein [Actinosynnema pretiosum]
MDFRLKGTREQVAVWVEVLRGALDVQSVSAFRPWTRDDPLSKVGAVYVTAELRLEDARRVVQATATRLDNGQAALPAAPRRRRRQLR